MAIPPLNRQSLANSSSATRLGKSVNWLHPPENSYGPLGTGYIPLATAAPPQSGGFDWGGLLSTAAGIGMGANPYTAVGMLAAKHLLPMAAGYAFGNPEAERAAELRDQSLAAAQSILPGAQSLARGELPAATLSAIQAQADKSRQAAAMSATRSGIQGSALAQAQQQRAAQQVSDTIAQQSLQAQQMGAQQVSGIAQQIAGIGQQFAKSGQQVDMQRQAVANQVAGLFEKPDADLQAMIKRLDQMGISITDLIKGMIEQGVFDPADRYVRGNLPETGPRSSPKPEGSRYIPPVIDPPYKDPLGYPIIPSGYNIGWSESSGL